jgi:uncharacterized membrane protein YfcA
MTASEILLLLSAAFAAGVLNAIAGGGSFLTLPALAFVGVPLVSANATGTAALLPGYLSGTWAFRTDLRAPKALSMAGLLGWSLCGGAVGAVLLLNTSNAAFKQIVPWLLLAATVLFAVGPHLLAMMGRGGPGPQAHGPAATWRARLCVFAVAVYGGYFNGGLGILLLAMFALLGESNINTMNGAKNLVSSILTMIAVALYAISGAIVWKYALMMMLASTAGGYAGGYGARLLPIRVVRAVVILTGLIMTVLFFLRA